MLHPGGHRSPVLYVRGGQGDLHGAIGDIVAI
jgi:hypothetical protein